MPSFTPQLKKLILLSALVALTGLAILIVILFGGGEEEELTSGQIALVAIILLLWPLGILVNHYRKRPKPEKQVEEPTGKSYSHLTEGVEAVTQWLRDSKTGAGRNGDALYRLPWFLIAGPPGSGKTSLLLSAGLSFSAVAGQRHSDQNLLRATRDCEWRVAEQAVLLDTAGRYQAEGPTHQEDREEWLGLIETLKKHRKERPLDGVMIVVSAARLLAAPDADLDQQAQMLRARLDDLTKSIGGQFPVYLVFAQADAVAGFNEFFRTLGSDERSQVWGATFPLAGWQTAYEHFDVEFNYLIERLMQRRLLRLATAPEPAEQLGVFDFPLRFAEARDKLGRFATALFKPSAFSEQPLLRGFYLTSSAPASAAAARVEDDHVEQARITEQGCFTEGFFKETLYRDRHVAASLRQRTAQPTHQRRLRLVAAGFSALALLLLIGMVISFARNQALIAEADAAGRAVLSHSKVERGAAAQDGSSRAPRDEELRDLETLRHMLAQLDENERSWVQPLFARFGLYSGGRINARLREVYFDFVSQRLLKPAVSELEKYLETTDPSASQAKAGASADASSGAESELDRYYNKLKVYLMLESQQRVEQDELQKQLAEHWAEPDGKANLAFFAQQASRDEEDDLRIPRLRANPDVVTRARARLANYPPISRVYNQLLSKINERIKRGGGTESVDLKKILEGQGADLYEAVNLRSVPGSFTKEAYYKYVLGEALTELAEEAKKEDYVTGEKGAQNINLSELKARYFRDYATHWQSFLTGIAISRSRLETKEKAEETLDRLAAPNSPMIFLAERVAYQTNLKEPPVTSGIIGWIKGFFASKVPVQEAQTLQTVFGPLHTFVNQKETGVKNYLVALASLRSKLRGIDGGWDKVAEKQREDQKTVGIKEAEDAVNASIGQLKGSPAGALLQQPVSGIRDEVSKGNYDEVKRRWDELYPLARGLESGFPFSESANEAPIKDFDDFFNPPNGKLKGFLDLARGYFSVQGDKWQVKDRGRFSTRFADYLSNAARLQGALYQGGQMKVECTITLASGAPIELSVDGKTIATPDKPTDTFSWPNDAGARIVSKNGGAPLALQGRWGLYRLFAAGGGSSRKAGQGYQLRWPGVQGEATLTPPSSLKDPFDLSLFRQLRAPRGLTEQ